MFQGDWTLATRCRGGLSRFEGKPMWPEGSATIGSAHRAHSNPKSLGFVRYGAYRFYRVWGLFRRSPSHFPAEACARSSSAHTLRKVLAVHYLPSRSRGSWTKGYSFRTIHTYDAWAHRYCERRASLYTSPCIHSQAKRQCFGLKQA